MSIFDTLNWDIIYGRYDNWDEGGGCWFCKYHLFHGEDIYNYLLGSGDLG